MAGEGRKQLLNKSRDACARTARDAAPVFRASQRAGPRGPGISAELGRGEKKRREKKRREIRAEIGEADGHGGPACTRAGNSTLVMAEAVCVRARASPDLGSWHPRSHRRRVIAWPKDVPQKEIFEIERDTEKNARRTKAAELTIMRNYVAWVCRGFRTILLWWGGFWGK